jgi:hypothetical protein
MDKEQIALAEASRAHAEQLREIAERSREDAEALREVVEALRRDREQLREALDAERATGEQKRIAAEAIRQEMLETVRATAESLEQTAAQMKVVEDMRRTLYKLMGTEH